MFVLRFTLRLGRFVPGTLAPRFVDHVLQLYGLIHDVFCSLDSWFVLCVVSLWATLAVLVLVDRIAECVRQLTFIRFVAGICALRMAMFAM